MKRNGRKRLKTMRRRRRLMQQAKAVMMHHHWKTAVDPAARMLIPPDMLVQYHEGPESVPPQVALAAGLLKD